MKAVLRKSLGIYFKRPKISLPAKERLKKERIHFSSLKMESPDFVTYLLSYIRPFVNPRYGLAHPQFFLLVEVQAGGIRIIRLGGIIVF